MKKSSLVFRKAGAQKPKQKEALNTIFRYQKPKEEGLMVVGDEKTERLKTLINALMNEALETCKFQEGEA
jgi:hypothetical protein